MRLYSFFLKTTLILSLHLIIATSSFAQTYKKVTVRLPETANAIEKNIADLLVSRLNEIPKISAKLEVKSGELVFQNDALSIQLGQDKHDEISKVFNEERIPKLSWLEPGIEGFLVKMIDAETPWLLAAGVDDRGCLYAVGEILRRIKPTNEGIELPSDLEVRTAPAFEIRGTQFGQSSVAKRYAHVRDWTEKETQRAILDYALAGANVFSVSAGPMFDFLKSFGLMTQGGFGANTSGRDIPDEWKASESIGRLGYACLSVPEAKAHMLEKCENHFKNSPTFDLIKFHGGDGGGCECDKCDPYGSAFIQTVEEMAAIIHKYHPSTRVYFTNQKFDNADDNAIFDYLNKEPREWLWAWGYGPGSDAASWQPGHRQTHRMDLFKYPGYGPYGLYPKEILHQIPSRHKLVYYNEITHWKYAQHAYIQMYPRADKNGDLPPHWGHDIYERRPDQYLTMVYNRLTFFAWPRFYHRVFNDLMPYGIGDITHSSGHHDHFNQWMWQRLLWAPRTSVEDVVNEYCTTWFGEDAGFFMHKALYLLEENMEEIPGKPLNKKESIEEYYQLVKQAGDRMTPEQKENNWLWQMYMQKGALDYYTKLAVIQQIELQNRVEEHLKNKSSVSDKAISDALSWMKPLQETELMIVLRKEAELLGEKSNRIYGVRNDGIFNLKHDFIGLEWLKRQMERAKNATGKERDRLLAMITDYENPGEGGYYDNLGTANAAPNIINGYPYDHGQPYVPQMLSEGNRHSQRSMHFTQDEAQGVTLHYPDLDPNALYEIRFTFVRPWYQERYSMRMNQRSQSIYADEQLISEGVELPLQMSDFFTFDIPAETTKDGKLTITLKKAPNVANGDRVTIEQWRNSGGWGTLVSEVWLIKK